MKKKQKSNSQIQNAESKNDKKVIPDRQKPSNNKEMAWQWGLFIRSWPRHKAPLSLSL